jgi:predicted alpha/beta superfamily hydrolase
MIRTWKIKIPNLSGSEQRLVYLYLPNDWKTSGKRYPVLYMFDGHNVFFDTHATYGKSWGMGEYLDKNEKQLIIVAVECSHKGHQRLSEYSPVDFSIPGIGAITGRGKEYMDWLVDTLKPYIDANYPTLPDREHTAIAGSSMGGLMSLYAVCDYNHIFKKAACMSPSFWVSKDKVLDIVANSAIAPDSSIYIDYGSLELPDHSSNPDALFSVTRLLLTRRTRVALKIIPGGAHNESSWEKQIPHFMEYLGL